MVQCDMNSLRQPATGRFTTLAGQRSDRRAGRDGLDCGNDVLSGGAGFDEISGGSDTDVCDAGPDGGNESGCES